MNAGARCRFLAVALLAAGHVALAGREAANVDLDYVARRAEERARKPFHSPRLDLPDFLRADKLTYDRYREIRFRRDRALWADGKLPFQVGFFHPGYLYSEPVHINEFVPGHTQDIRFVSDFFDYGNLHLDKQIPADTGYAGFRVFCCLNQPTRWDELGSFLGASYYRLLGAGQRYGPSARGLALDCGEDGRAEEFPLFTDWWLGKPAPGDKQLHLFAILDSVSCAGAWEFRIIPGQTTVADVDVVLYFRQPADIAAADPKHQPVDSVGWAPLTSMFWFGPSSEARFDDYRPAVHDSDGLLMRLASGQMIWRPLDDPPRLVHQRFDATNLLGFGLLQRNREFTAYQDLFNLYNDVPSIWIQPRGQWGRGQLHLVELNTGYEGLDNIVAFWSPEAKPAPMQPVRFGYTQYWTRETDMTLSTNKVVSTLVGRMIGGDRRQFAVDFFGPGLIPLSESKPPQAVVDCSSGGSIVDLQVFKVAATGSWRVMFIMAPAAGDKRPVDLQCRLQNENQPLTETWSYTWNPP